MASRSELYLRSLTRLWLRLTAIFAAASLLALALLLFPGKAMGWFYYLSVGEVAYEVFARAVFAATAAAALAAVLTLAAAPFLRAKASRARTASTVIRIASGTALFLDLFVALIAIADGTHLSGAIQGCLCLAYAVVFAGLLANRKWRFRLTSQFDGILGERSARRIGFAIAAALLVSILAAARSATVFASAETQRSVRPHPNILLVTFDALSAEDMSVYGYRLPTTPRLDEFAAKATVFTNFYSSSTFTTPSLASLVTGLAPSETGVYHLPGRLRGERAAQTLMRVLHQSGYATAGMIASPMAYFFASWQRRDFDLLEGPVYRTSDFLKLWDTLAVFHPLEPFGSRLDEFEDTEKAWHFLPLELHRYAPSLLAQSRSGYPPAEVFERARSAMRGIPEGFFLWVHVLTPHYPFLPDAHLGRFLPTGEMRTAEEQISFSAGQTYTKQQQPAVDKARLRYDEFIADADSAFGAFLSGLQTDGRLENTAVIVTADHGESFQGGVYKHEHPFQIFPEIHIPLIVRMPGQDHMSRVTSAADQTALAPTILEIARLPRAAWMRGPSLVPSLEQNAGRGAEGSRPGLAFTEYLETSGVFRPPHSGTVGVNDGVHQYVVNLATGQGIFRNLSDMLAWRIDHSEEDPAAAKALHDALYTRFPYLPAR